MLTSLALDKNSKDSEISLAFCIKVVSMYLCWIMFRESLLGYFNCGDQFSRQENHRSDWSKGDGFPVNHLLIKKQIRKRVLAHNESLCSENLNYF